MSDEWGSEAPVIIGRDGLRWVRLEVHLRDTVTGTTGIDTKSRGWIDGDEVPGHVNAFWWEEGNAACDCNRMAFLYDTAGADDPDAEESDGYPCGDGRVVIDRIVRLDTGEVIYSETAGV